MVLTVSPGYLTTYGRRSTMDQKDFDTWKASTASILAIFTSSNNNYTLCLLHAVSAVSSPLGNMIVYRDSNKK